MSITLYTAHTTTSLSPIFSPTGNDKSDEAQKHIKRGSQHLRMGNLEGALNEFETALESTPLDHQKKEIYNYVDNITQTLERQKSSRPGGSFFLPRKSRILAKAYMLQANLEYGQAITLLRQEKFQEAAPRFEAFIQSHPSHPKATEAHRHLAELYLFSDRIDEAIACLSAANELDPSDGGVVFLLGQLLFARDETSYDWEETKNLFEAALEDPKIIFDDEQKQEIYYMLASTTYQHDPQTPEEASQRMIDLRNYANLYLSFFPNNAFILGLRATVYWEQGYMVLEPGDTDRSYWLNAAVDEFEKAFALDKGLLTVFGMYLAQSYLGLEQFGDALQIYEEYYAQKAVLSGVEPSLLYGTEISINEDLDTIIYGLEKDETNQPLIEKAYLLSGQTKSTPRN
ncbi:MAG: tetratricopeptide repeat protein [Candidatus Saganbacteria bacterium]|nr:tetratricopeptide repeat protein [Candidatus Saganbacteria bacterium]